MHAELLVQLMPILATHDVRELCLGYASPMAGAARIHSFGVFGPWGSHDSHCRGVPKSITQVMRIQPVHA